MKEVAFSAAVWDSDLPIGDEFLDRLAGFIRGLREIDPVFSELYLTGNRAQQGLRVDDAPGNLENFLRAKWPMSIGGMPLRSMSLNLKLGASTGRSRGERSNTFKLNALPVGNPELGGSDLAGCVEIKLFDRNSPLLNPEVSERLLKYLVEFWSPYRAITATRTFVLRSGGFGWLNYWDDPNLAPLLPDWVHREPLSKGVFFRLGDGRILSKKNTDEVRTSLAILNALMRGDRSAPSKKDTEKIRFYFGIIVAFTEVWWPGRLRERSRDALRKMKEQPPGK